MSIVVRKEAKQTTSSIPYWGELPKGSSDMARAVFHEVDRIDRETISEQNERRKACAMYGRLDTWGNQLIVDRLIPPHKRIAHNVLATAIDALGAEVTTTKPRPLCQTLGGNFRERRKARLHTHYYDAKFHLERVRYKTFQAVRDACVPGLGIVQVYRKYPHMAKQGKDEVGIRRIFPLNFVIDDTNCLDEPPRQCYLKHSMDKRHSMKKWAKHAKAIEQSRAPRYTWKRTAKGKDNRVEIIESWSLPSYPGAKDGKHIICCENAVLFEEEWDCEFFPFAFLRAVPPQHGFWGEKIIMRGETSQYELNKLLRRVQQSMHVHAVPRVFMPRQAGIVKGQVRNNVGIVIEYDGNQPPLFLTPQSIGSDVYEHIRLLESWIFKELGVSELSATSRKPAGLDSGVALRSYNDVQSQRWLHLERSFEEMYVRIAELLEYFEGKIADDYSGHMVGATHREFLQTMKWSDIRLDRTKIAIRVQAASALPNTPAGKLSALEDMVRNQVITPEEFVMMSDMPDLEAIRNMKLAPREYFEDLFDKFLDGEEKFRQPEPHMNFMLGREVAGLKLAQAEMEGASQEEMRPVRNWIRQSFVEEKAAMKEQMRDQQEMMAEAQGGMAPSPAPGAAVVPGQGAPAPQPQVAGEAV